MWGHHHPNGTPNLTQFHLVNVEPYTSEMYSALLQPSMQTLERNYVQYGKKRISKEVFMRGLLIAPIKGIAFGINRSLFTVVFRNIHQDWENTPEPRPAKDIFYIKHYLNFRQYPTMLRGLSTELKIECSYQIFKSYLNTVSKYSLNLESDNFLSNLGFTFARSFTANLITATTFYPLALNYFTDNDTETIVHKLTKRAGSGSLVSGMISVGISITRSTLPSYTRMISFAKYLLGD